MKVKVQTMPSLFTPLTVGVLAVLLTTSITAEGFIFSLPARKHRCFVEELPTGVEVVLKYHASHGYSQFVDVKISDPDNNIIWEDTGKDRGQYHATIHTPGEYAVCFYSRLVAGAKYSADLKRDIAFELRTGADTQDYGRLATREHLKPMEVDLRVLEDVTRGILSDYQYFKERDESARQTSEHMFSRSVWMAVIVMSGILGFSLWQVRHLKRHFKKKRLID